MAWALFNAIPPALFFFYACSNGRALRVAAAAAHAAALLLAAVAVACLWLLSPGDRAPSEVMPAVAAFLDGTRAAGPLPGAAREAYPWLRPPLEVALGGLAAAGNSSRWGGAAAPAGGFYADGWGASKATMPHAWSLALLAWSLLVFPRGVEEVRAGAGRPALGWRPAARMAGARGYRTCL